MSEKRVTPGSKGIKSSSSGSASRPNVNAATGPNRRCRSNHNSTISTPRMLPTNAVPDDNTDFELTMAYNTYLQDLLKKEILEKSIKKQKMKCNDQLEMYRNSMEKCKKEEASLKAELEEKRNIIDLERNVQEMEAELLGNEEILHNTSTQIESLVQLLTVEHNKLHLKNVEVLNTEEEYNSLNKLMGECTDKLEKFQNAIGDSEGLKELTDSLNSNVKLQGDVVNKIRNVQNVAEKANNLVLEIVSDLLTKKT